jgi:hypothetical protein
MMRKLLGSERKLPLRERKLLLRERKLLLRERKLPPVSPGPFTGHRHKENESQYHSTSNPAARIEFRLQLVSPGVALYFEGFFEVAGTCRLSFSFELFGGSQELVEMGSAKKDSTCNYCELRSLLTGFSRVLA